MSLLIFCSLAHEPGGFQGGAVGILDWRCWWIPAAYLSPYVAYACMCFFNLNPKSVSAFLVLQADLGRAG